MENNTIKSFSIYKEYYELITLVPRKERAELLLAISEYMFDGVEPELNDNQMKIFNNLKRPLLKSCSKSKNGSKSKKNDNEIETKQNQNEIKTKSNENQNEIKIKSKQNQNEIKMKSKQNQNNNEKKSHQDVNVNVVVNNNTLNNKNNSNSKNSTNTEDSNRDRVIGEEEEKETIPNSIINFVENNYGRSLTPYEFDEVNALVKTHSEEIVLKAYKAAFEQNINKLSYIKGILKTWKDCGLNTIEEIEKDMKKGKRSASERKLDAVFARARARMGEENE